MYLALHRKLRTSGEPCPLGEALGMCYLIKSQLGKTKWLSVKVGGLVRWKIYSRKVQWVKSGSCIDIY